MGPDLLLLDVRELHLLGSRHERALYYAENPTYNFETAPIIPVFFSPVIKIKRK
jgi:hypothetical protein